MLTNDIKNQIREYAISNKGKEVCGLLVKSRDEIIFYKCKNISPDPKDYCTLNPFDYIRVSEKGKIVAHIHSQEDKEPSFLDYRNAVSHNIYSIIYSYKYDKFSIIEPKLKNYLNVDYSIGKNDCFGMVRNYYKNELNIDINDYNRDAGWEIIRPNYILELFEKEGFYKINLEDIKRNDVIIFNFNDIPQHISIYMGNEMILHHPEEQKSIISELTKALKKRINIVIRHKDIGNE